MVSPYASAARGIEAGFGMAQRADEMAEEKRRRKVQEERQAAADARADEVHGLKVRQIQTELSEHEEDRATKGVTARLAEIERQSAAAQSAGGKVDPALAREHGELTDLMAGRARRARGVLERLSPAAQTGGDAPNMAVGAAGATDTDLGAIAQQARDFWSRAATGQVDPLQTSGPELRMHLAAATGVKVDELPTVVAGARDIQTGMETGNEGLIVSGMNKAMLGRLKIGVGGPSPYGGEITRKEIIGLDPAIDAAGNAHPNRFIPRLRVYVAGVSPTGDELYYDAPMTQNGSTEEGDKVVGIDIKRGMDWLGNMGLLSEIVKRPDLATKLKEGDGGKSDAYIDNLRRPMEVLTNLTKPHPKQIVDQRTGRVSLLFPDGTVREAIAPSAKPLTPVEQASVEEKNSRTDINKARLAGTLPAPKKAVGGGGGGGGGGGSGGAAVPPGAAGKTGEAFLAALDTGTANVIRGLDEGRLSLKDLSTRGGHREQMMKLWLQYNPEGNARKYQTGQQTENSFARGVEGRAVRSFNVMVDHMDTLMPLIDALGNGNIQLVNKISNAISAQFGGTAITNFESAKKIVTDELTKAIIGGVTALGDRKHMEQTVANAQSPQQLKQIIETYQKLAAGQLSGLRRQYEAGGGLKDFDDEFLSPRTRQLLGALEPDRAPRRGGTPAAPAGGARPAPTQADRDYAKRSPALTEAFKRHFGVDP